MFLSLRQKVDLAARMHETQTFAGKCERGERRLEHLASLYNR